VLAQLARHTVPAEQLAEGVGGATRAAPAAPDAATFAPGHDWRSRRTSSRSRREPPASR